MPISATGISNSSRRARKCCRSMAGLTLMEILVVVVIIGVISTAFLLSLTSGRQDEGQTEAQRFVALVSLAGQEAMLRSRDLAVEILPRGYRFLISEQQAWQPAEDDVLRPRQLPEGMAFDVQLDGSAIVLSDDEEQQPRIYLFSTGEMTPFVLILRQEEGGDSFRISGGADGKTAVSEQH